MAGTRPACPVRGSVMSSESEASASTSSENSSAEASGEEGSSEGVDNVEKQLVALDLMLSQEPVDFTTTVTAMNSLAQVIEKNYEETSFRHVFVSELDERFFTKTADALDDHSDIIKYCYDHVASPEAVAPSATVQSKLMTAACCRVLLSCTYVNISPTDSDPGFQTNLLHLSQHGSYPTRAYATAIAAYLCERSSSFTNDIIAASLPMAWLHRLRCLVLSNSLAEEADEAALESDRGLEDLKRKRSDVSPGQPGSRDADLEEDSRPAKLRRLVGPDPPAWPETRPEWSDDSPLEHLDAVQIRPGCPSPVAAGDVGVLLGFTERVGVVRFNSGPEIYEVYLKHLMRADPTARIVPMPETRIPARPTPSDDGLAVVDVAAEVGQVSEAEAKVMDIRALLQALSHVGEYKVLVASIIKERTVDVTLWLMVRQDRANAMVVYDTLQFVNTLLAHKRFTMDFLQRGGLNRIFAFPERWKRGLAVVLGQFMHGISAHSGVMEYLCHSQHLSPLVATNMDRMVVSCDEAPADNELEACRRSALFFFNAFSTRAVLKEFDSRDGLDTLFLLIRRSRGLARTSAGKAALSDSCSCLRNYLRMHVILVAESVRVEFARRSRSGSAHAEVAREEMVDIDSAVSIADLGASFRFKLPGPQPDSKPTVIDSRSLAAAVSSLLRHRSISLKLMDPAVWRPLGHLLRLKAIPLLLSVLETCGGVVEKLRGLAETAELALECLFMLTLHTKMLPVLAAELDSGRLGMAVLLEAVGGLVCSRDPLIIKNALLVLCNCVGALHIPSCHLSVSFPSTALQGPLVSSRRCTCKGLDDLDKEPLRKVARSSNAIKVCISLLRPETKLQSRNAVAIRLLCCSALLGLARDKAVVQILEKLKVSRLLTEAIRDTGAGQAGTDRRALERLMALAEELMALASGVSGLAAKDVTDPAIRRMEKAHVVAQTRVTFDERELLQVIHDHLAASGLHTAASALRTEAGLAERQAASLAAGGQAEAPTPSAVPPSQPGQPRARLKISLTPSLAKNIASQTSARLAEADDLGSARPDTRARTSSKSASAVRKSISFKTPAKESARSLGSDSLASVSSKRKHTPGHSAPFSGGVTAGQALSSASDAKASTTVLSSIVRQYLRAQHRQCEVPIAVLPPFSLTAKHVCPIFRPLQAQLNVANRLMGRETLGGQAGGGGSALMTRKLVYSRFRQMRTYRDADTIDKHSRSASFLSTSQLLVAYRGSQLALFNTWTTGLEITYPDVFPNLDYSFVKVSACPERMTNGQAASRFVLMDRTADVGLLQLSGLERESESSFFLQQYWRGVTAAELSHSCKRVVAVSLQGKGALIYDIATGLEVQTLTPPAWPDSASTTPVRPCFSLTDDMVLSHNILWDTRSASPIHSFDNISLNSCRGYFVPSGCEVIIDSAIWDLRSCRLLTVVKELENSRVTFNPAGDVMFAHSCISVEDAARARHPGLHNCINVIDAVDFSLIESFEVGKLVQDLCIDPTGGYVATAEIALDMLASGSAYPSAVRLYEVGRCRPRDDDSDIDDADTSDSSAEEEEEEEDWLGNDSGAEDEGEFDEVATRARLLASLLGEEELSDDE